MESNGQSRNQPEQRNLNDLRLSDYDRMLGQRYVEQGEVLAELVIRASRGIRALLSKTGKLLHAALVQKQDYVKHGAVHGD